MEHWSSDDFTLRLRRLLYNVIQAVQLSRNPCKVSYTYAKIYQACSDNKGGGKSMLDRPVEVKPKLLRPSKPKKTMAESNLKVKTTSKQKTKTGETN